MRTTMARPKKPGQPAEGPKAPDPARQPTAVTIRGSKEWRAWLERGAQHCLTDTSKLIDVAVTQYLKGQGFEETRPKR